MKKIKLGIDNKKSKEKGLTLIEALISTVIVGIGFVAVFQMVNYSVQSIGVSTDRSKINYLSQSGIIFLTLHLRFCLS